MKIVGILSTAIQAGTINTDATFATMHNCGGSNIWGRPELQLVSMGDGGSINTYVSQFQIDNQTPKDVNHMSDFVNNCKQITYSMYTSDCFGRAHCITYFLGT